jgi:hypothetical protein
MPYIRCTSTVTQYFDYDLTDEQYRLYKENPELFWETYHNDWSGDLEYIDEDVQNETLEVYD